MKKAFWFGLAFFLLLFVLFFGVMNIQKESVYVPRPSVLHEPEIEPPPVLPDLTPLNDVVEQIREFPATANGEWGEFPEKVGADVDDWFISHAALLDDLQTELIALDEGRGCRSVFPPVDITEVRNHSPFRRGSRLLFEAFRRDALAGNTRGVNRNLRAILSLGDMMRCSEELVGLLIALKQCDQLMALMYRLRLEGVDPALVERFPVWDDWSSALKSTLKREFREASQAMELYVYDSVKRQEILEFFQLYHRGHTRQLIEDNYLRSTSFTYAGELSNEQQASNDGWFAWLRFNSVGYRIAELQDMGPWLVRLVRYAGLVSLKSSLETLRLSDLDEMERQEAMDRLIDPLSGEPVVFSVNGQAWVLVPSATSQMESWSPVRWGQMPFGQPYGGLVLIEQ